MRWWYLFVANSDSVFVRYAYLRACVRVYVCVCFVLVVSADEFDVLVVSLCRKFCLSLCVLCVRACVFACVCGCVGVFAHVCVCVCFVGGVSLSYSLILSLCVVCVCVRTCVCFSLLLVVSLGR